MSDYSSLKVADLKAECKKRGIPQTGLRLKQQFIDKLIELDSQTEQDKTEAALPADETPESQSPAPETVSQVPESGPEKPQNEQPEEPKEQAVAQPEKTAEPVSALDQPQDEEKQTGEPTQEETSATADVKLQQVEDVAKPTETQAENASSDDKKSPAAPAQAQVDQVTQDAKNEPAKPEENPTPPTAQVSEANTGLSTPLPVEEALEDTRKRKRRSQSPAPTAEEIANRKARAKETVPRVLLKDEEAPVTREEGLGGAKSEGQNAAEDQNEKQPVETSTDSHKIPAKQDARFRGLFAPTGAASQPASPPRDVTMEDADVTPALHAATASLYIDGLMRPLQPNALRKHLVSLGSAPGTEDSDPIIEFYLDSIKTHSFVSFSSLAAASRVRSAIHGTVWPNERNRKNLRADFIPDEKIKEWIQIEEESRDRAGPAVRWEVRYDTSDEETTATLAEVGSAPSGRRESGFNRTPPLGPRSDIEQLDRRLSNAPGAAPVAPPQPGQGFKPLDELFKSTTAKPKLYYLPVPRPVADKRLDQFDELIRKGTFPRRGGDEMRRITFENEDQFVDIGPERFGPGPRSGAGPRGRGRGGRRGNSWRS
ncbi:DNA-binding SAP [Penicillium paradoxum]|uniref:DNA-binding SAP n=1 Tax=Penicillium paradoxum TaxID=176176 RepID=UPI002548AFBA|nr:DNA-binding SAP [Penicillium paradoxum]KAJ5795044.1 DNA-binding SAP [Penicillium paradoxum]